MNLNRVGVLCRADGVTIEVLTEPHGGEERALIVERQAESGARRVVATMETAESAQAEAELHVLRAGGLLATGAAQLLGQRAGRYEVQSGAWLWHAPVCR